MVEVIRKLIPSFSHFEELTIPSKTGETIGHQSVLVTHPHTPFAGGTARDLNTARRICAAEAIERAHFESLILSGSEARSKFLLDEYPTTCGFAAGFSERATVFRAVCEAIERWAWSKWIDERFSIPIVQPAVEGALKEYYASCFDRVIYFQIGLKFDSVQLPSFVPQDLVLSVVLGVKGTGIFPGSRVTTAGDDTWEHALLEAWRHLKIFENELRDEARLDLFDRRILKYGRVGSDVIERLTDQAKGLSSNWPAARLHLLKEVANTGQYFVWRALCDDYVGWDKGDESRFIY